ncbi:MAG: cupin domain-containing protein [Acidobacteria bacterium]|jgi:quercetin dioxygenase-like cupin family protein|nr:cupin domain-containing protein [Acidobacteriota bacterium]
MELDYTRIFEDREEESHFEDVDVEVSLVDFAPPAPPLNLSEPLSAERIILADVPAGWVGDWHPTPRRQFAVVLSGELEVEVSDGEVRRFGPGGVVLLEDVGGKGHLTRALGDSEARIAFVQLS